MVEFLEFVIGGGFQQHVSLRLLKRQRPDEHDYWDGNWIDARVEFHLGGIRGEFDCFLRAEEFEHFLPQMRQLEKDLVGPAEFSTLEGQVEFQIRGDGRGHLTAKGSLLDQAGSGNRVDWSLVLDQTYLQRMISAVENITEKYPVRGAPR